MKLTTELLTQNVLDFDGNPIGNAQTNDFFTIGKVIRIALNSTGGPGKVVDPAEKDRIFDLSVAITNVLRGDGEDLEVSSDDIKFIIQKCRDGLTPESFGFVRDILTELK